MNNNRHNITAKPLALWFLNSILQESELRSQVTAMKQKGFGGFFMHWLDCEEPYMSESWLRSLDIMINEAEKHNMEAWLYDEAWCPSCFAGGRILARRPDLQLKTIWNKQIDATHGEEISFDFELMKVLRICAVPIKSGKPVIEQTIDLRQHLGTIASDPRTPYRHKHGYYPNIKPIKHWRTSGSNYVWRLKWQPPAGEWRIYIICARETLIHDNMNRLDVLNPESIKLFLQETHEAYAKRYGKYFGNVIPGIMTDEPKYWPMPWTDTLPEKFKQQYNIDFLEIMPALFDDSYPNAAAMKTAYQKLVSDMFRENYIVPMAEWCNEHNLLLVGHISPEECLREEVMFTGSIPRLLESFDIPGTDLIIQSTGTHENMALNMGPKMASSVARQQGSSEVFVEYGACCNENLSIEQLKHMIDWLLVTGCNMFCHHSFSYSLEDMRKYTAGVSLGTGMRIWEHWNLITEYTEQRCSLLREYRPENKIALLKPQTAIRGLLGKSEQIEQQYIELIGNLIEAHIGFDLIDEDTAEAWVCTGGQLQCGHAKYSTVIISPLPYISRVCADKLNSFAAQQGELIIIDNTPSILDSSGEQNWTADFVKHSSNDVVKILPPDAEISGVDSEHVFIYRGKNDSGDELLFLVNMLAKAVHIDCNGMKFYLPPLGSLIPGIDSVPRESIAATQPVSLEPNWRISADKLNHIPLHDARTKFKIAPEIKEVYLVLEASEVNKLAESLFVNGVKPNLQAAVPGFIYDKSNRFLQLIPDNGELVIEYDYNTFATLLVAGDFTAFNEDSAWCLLPKQSLATTLDSTACGYPFFNGILEFSTSFNLSDDLSDLILELPGRSGVVEAYLNEDYKDICAWQPDYLHIGTVKAGEHRLSLRFSGTVTGILRDPHARFGVDGSPQLYSSIQSSKTDAPALS